MSAELSVPIGGDGGNCGVSAGSAGGKAGSGGLGAGGADGGGGQVARDLGTQLPKLWAKPHSHGCHV